MSFFSLDSKFSQIMGRVFDLMMLNIIFLIMCIPIVTIGANFTAMYYVTLKMIKNGDVYLPYLLEILPRKLQAGNCHLAHPAGGSDCSDS